MRVRQRFYGSAALVAVAATVPTLLPAATPTAASAISPNKAFDLDAMTTLAWLSSPALRPDGSYVALIASEAGKDDAASRQTLVLVEVATGRRRILATGKVAAPAWSADGKALAWLQSDKRGTRQIMRWTMAASGSDAQALTALAPGTGVQSFAWAPAGGAIAYLAAEASPEPKGAAAADKSFEFPDVDYLSTTYLARSAGDPPMRLWLLPERGAARLLPTGPGTAQDLTWRPDGAAIFVTSRPGNSEASSTGARIDAVTVADGAVAPVVAGSANPGSGLSLALSGKGTLAYRHFRGPDPWTYSNQVAVVRAGAPVDLTARLDRDVTDFEWLPGQETLLVKAQDGLDIALWKVDAAGEPRKLKLGDVVPLSPTTTARNGMIAFIGSEPLKPQELYVMKSADRPPVRVTAFNADATAYRYGRVERLSWKNDGFVHEGVLTYPPDYDPARKYPLFVRIHGGPEASSTATFNEESQFFATRGWMIFEPNYRGSSGRGDAYQASIVGDPVKSSARDVMAGVAMLTDRKDVDKGRVAVDGWSWGGVMTSWLIGHHQSFCAAMPGAMVIDFADYYNQSETGFWIRTMIGSPYKGDDRRLYVDQSPATYLDKVTTPTLVLHNAGDPNAPVTQSLALHHALKDRGVPVRLVLRDVDKHGYGYGPESRDIFVHETRWMDEHCAVKDAP